MRHLLAIAYIALAAISASQTAEKIDASRQFKVGDVHKYKLVAKIQEGQDVEIKGTIEAKVSKEAKDGAEIDYKCTDFSQIVGGTNMGGDPPAAGTTKLSKNNLPESLVVKNNGAVYVIVSIASYLPATTLSVGEEFKVDWKGKDDGGTITGTGKLVEVKTVDGVRVGVIKSTLRVLPSGETNAADLEITSEFNLANGSLMHSKGKGGLENGSFKFTVDLVK